MILLGTLVLWGYATANLTLKSGLPGFVSMNPVTAIGFVLMGVSLVILLVAGKSRALKFFGLVCAGTATLVGVLKLGGLITGTDVVFDGILFSPQVTDPTAAFLNRIAPNTAVNITFIGIALILSFRRKNMVVAQALASAAFFIGFLAILGYLFGVNDFIGLADYMPMALNTAFGFLVLSTGVLLATPGSGLMKTVTADDAGGAVARRLLPISLVIPVFIAVVSEGGRRAEAFTAEFSALLTVITSTIVFAVTIWLLAIKLHKLDAERQLTQRSLDEARIKDKLLLSSIGDGVMAIDSDWNIIRWNTAATKITGWTEQEAVGKHFKDVVSFIGAEDRIEDVRFITDAMLTNQVRFMGDNVLLINKDGKDIPVGDCAASIVDLNGAVIGAIIVLRDVTVERELRKKEHEMIKLKDDFLFRTIHDLRSPTTIIRLALDLRPEDGTLTDIDRPKLQKGIDMIQEANARIMRLVEDLLKIAKGENADTVLKKERVDLGHLVKKTLDALSVIRRSRKITANYEPPTEKVYVMADPDALKEIFDNLINNAIKYNNNGGSITIGHAVAGDSHVVFVQDTGIGIAPESATKLFTPYFRAVGNEIPGTGLGLYIVKKLLEKMNGDIRVESTLGQGAKFTVSLPRN